MKEKEIVYNINLLCNHNVNCSSGDSFTIVYNSNL